MSWVAVIGTGASTIQFVPEIQPKVGKLHLFQRAAPWVIPHRNDRNGHNSALWPTYGWPFRRRLHEFDAAAYALGTRVPVPGGERERAAAAHA